MEIMNAIPAELGRALRDYRRLRAVLPVGPLRTGRDYRHAAATLDRIIDLIGDDEKHPLAELAEILSVFIEKYDEEHFPLRAAAPAQVVEFLMEQHDLRQSDLPEIGSQGVVSEVLAGKRALNAAQIRRLAKRFGISPEVLL